jgi:uncharacterized protein YdeI (YjbR/CyaY-like superfamily)
MCLLFAITNRGLFDFSMGQTQPTLKRLLNPMPAFVREALEAKALMATYEARPPYQRNDYLGWIARAKLPDTQQKRLAQMLDELQRGNVYMKMAWRGSARP